MQRFRLTMMTLLVLLTMAGAALAADPDAECQERLTRLGNLCLLYERQHDGQRPAKLSDLYYEAYVSDLDDFVCPAKTVTILDRTEIDGQSGYVLCEAGAGAPQPVVQDRPENHGGQGMYVFYSDGTVRLERKTRAPTPPVATQPPVTTAETELPERLRQRPAKDTEVWSGVGSHVCLGIKTTAVEQSGAAQPQRLKDVLKDLAIDLLRGLGLDLPREDADPGGLRVDEFQSGSIIAWWGLQPGDVLVALGKRMLAGTSLTEAVAKAKPGTKPKLALVRDGEVVSKQIALLDMPVIAQRPPGPWSGPQEEVELVRPLTDLVLCTDLDGAGVPVAPGNRFASGNRRVACCLWYENAPATPVQIMWYQGTAASGSSVGLIEGRGRLTASFFSGKTGQFPVGPYRVAVHSGGRIVASRLFVIE